MSSFTWRISADRHLLYSVPSARSSGSTAFSQIRCHPIRLSSVDGRDLAWLRRREGSIASRAGGMPGNRSRTASFCSVISVAVCSLIGSRRRIR